MWKWFKSSGIIFAILSAFSGVASEALGFAKDWVFAQFTTTVDVDSDDPLFELLSDWLSEHPMSKKSNHFEAHLETVGDDDGESEDDDDDDMMRFLRRKIFEENGIVDEGKVKEFSLKNPIPGVALLPNRSSYHFVHNGTFIFIRFVLVTANDSASHKAEVSAFGKRREAVHEFLTDVVTARHREKKKVTKIYVSNKSSWRRMMQKRMRPIESVILPAGMMEDLLHDAKKFLTSLAKYEERGTPHRRGYLFHGLPGTGKSSLVQALAGELGLDIYILRMSKDTMDDDIMEHLVLNMSPGGILLIEDVDAAFTRRKGGNNIGRNLTFSGLLNVLDGVASAEGRILAMTTNHMSRLDPALIRAGRVDRRFEINYADAEQVVRMYIRFFPEVSAEMACTLGESVAANTCTMAQVQQYFLMFDTGEDAYVKRGEFLSLVNAVGPDASDYDETEQDDVEDDNESRGYLHSSSSAMGKTSSTFDKDCASTPDGSSSKSNSGRKIRSECPPQSRRRYIR